MSDTHFQHAFVSYVHEDSDAVDQLVSILQEGASIPVWKDTGDLWPGEDWRQKIRQAIEEGSLAFIACFSTNSVHKAKTGPRQLLGTHKPQPGGVPHLGYPQLAAQVKSAPCSEASRITQC